MKYIYNYKGYSIEVNIYYKDSEFGLLGRASVYVNNYNLINDIGFNEKQCLESQVKRIIDNLNEQGIK